MEFARQTNETRLVRVEVLSSPSSFFSGDDNSSLLLSIRYIRYRIRCRTSFTYKKWGEPEARPTKNYAAAID
ncbi:hypothetical protein QUB63_15405 [Microcoleus sp. ARI1-B5]|uniref:hypothetical protein n=1 Tax=unclassified Microcoleus TaxID=2642155 RepID=UPI002FD23789